MNAKRLASKLDQGDGLVAIAPRDDAPGKFGIVPHVLVANRKMVEQLRGMGHH